MTTGTHKNKWKLRRSGGPHRFSPGGSAPVSIGEHELGVPPQQQLRLHTELLFHTTAFPTTLPRLAFLPRPVLLHPLQRNERRLLLLALQRGGNSINGTQEDKGKVKFERWAKNYGRVDRVTEVTQDVP